jgi:hypothetical protein
MAVATVLPFFPSHGRGAALSPEGKSIDDVSATFRGESSISLSGRYMALDALWEEAGRDGWDGYSARPVSAVTYWKAKAFLAVVPPSLSQPRVSADPDGEVAFEWYAAPDLVFSVSIGPSGLLSYAGLFGRNKIYGSEQFLGELPRPIAESLSRLYSDPRAAWAAK